VQEQSDFELAKQLLEEGQQKRIMFYVWLAFFALFMSLSLLYQQSVLGFTLPSAMVAGVLALLKGFSIYSNSPSRVSLQVRQEMEWLLGANWLEIGDEDIYSFALARVRLRQKEQRLFLIHLFIFINVNLCAFAWGYYGAITYRNPIIPTVFIITAIWLPLLIRHSINAFPTKGRLVRREQKVWETLQLHLGQIRPDKQKRKEKPKRDTSYRLGDDGELVEEEEAETIDWWDEDPKTDASTGL